MSDTNAAGLGSKLLPELKQIAGGLGIRTTGMKKADLVAAIRQAQGGGQPKQRPEQADQRQDRQQDRQSDVRRDERSRDEQSSAPTSEQPREQKPEQPQQPGESGDRPRKQGKKQSGPAAQASDQRAADAAEQQAEQKPAQKSEPKSDEKSDQQADQQADRKANQKSDGDKPAAEDGEGGGRRNRRRRSRERNQQGGQGNQQGGQQGNQGGQQGNQGGRGNRNEPDLNILEDDVLAPCAGILDVLDNYAFVRTSGYLAGPDDVYVAMSMVRKYGLRRGDAITGQVRQPREGERREKFNPLVMLDSVNGADPEAARTRPEFDALTPVHPTERLRMETSSAELTGRAIDLVAPVGKGQRGLIVAPVKSGRTSTLHTVAQAIAANHPEVHLMVVLVDERPEEVTDFERSVRGEVVSATFDRPASDQTTVAELAIERAKRLVELGHDVVVLLDGLTRLGRAYNMAAPANGRVLDGGIDASALYPTRRFFGAARNVEDGGSLTILATAVVESGSRIDEVLFEELSVSGNQELRLRRDLADRRAFPAIDVVQSGTRGEELLLSPEELAIVRKLRATLADLDPGKALEHLLTRLRRTQANVEFLMQMQKSTPSSTDGSR